MWSTNLVAECPWDCSFRKFKQEIVGICTFCTLSGHNSLPSISMLPHCSHNLQFRVRSTSLSVPPNFSPGPLSLMAPHPPILTVPSDFYICVSDHALLFLTVFPVSLYSPHRFQCTTSLCVHPINDWAPISSHSPPLTVPPVTTINSSNINFLVFCYLLSSK